MTNKPYFSVVIPCYNRAKFIHKTILSVLGQSYPNFELIIIDDGSTDDTCQVVSAIDDKRLRYFRITNSERGAARNAGFRKSHGEYVNFLDSDDCIYPNHLNTAINFIQAQNSPPIFHLAYDTKDENGKLLGISDGIKNINTQILRGNLLSCNGVFIRHNVMLQNLFNEDRALASLEDWELWIRLSARFSFLHLPKITSTVIQHDDRSVMTTDISIIKRKVAAFINAVRLDSINQKIFGKEIDKVFASANTYAALHIALTGTHKEDVFRYLLKGIRMNPLEIFTKRFIVIIKWFLFK